MELFKLLGTIAISNKEAIDSMKETTDEAEHSENKLSSAFKKIGAAVVTYFAADKIRAFGQECVNMASDVQEVQNKFDVVFQGMNEDVEKWAKTYADSIGRNSNTIKAYLADNQNMFVGMGMTREEGAKLSEQMVELGLDLASFNNLQESDAVNALSKALMGETESAKRLGAVLNENTLAMAQEQLGYSGKFQSLTEAQKMEVRYQAILMQSTDAVGDCARSLDSYKGRQIQAQSAMENLKETIGTRLLPFMTKLQEGFAKVTNVIVKYVDPAFDLLEEIVEGLEQDWNEWISWTLENLIGAFKGIFEALSPIGEALISIMNPMDNFSEASVDLRIIINKLDDFLWVIIDSLNSFAEWLGSHQKEVQAFAGFIQEAFGKVQDIIKFVFELLETVWNTIGVPIWDAIKYAIQMVYEAFAERMPEIQAFFEETVADIKDAWENHLKPALEAIGAFLDKTLKPIFEMVFKKFILPVVDMVFGSIKKAWESVLKPVFNGICDFLTGVFTGNWKKAFEGIWGILKGIINAIIGGFELMVNNAISAINKVLGVVSTVASAIGSIFGIEKPVSIALDYIDLPRLAKGGVLEKGQMGLLEGNGAEAVVPLERNKARISAVADDMNTAGVGGGSESLEILKKIESLLQFMVDFMPDDIRDAIADGLKLDINGREFARMVKAV